jgi:hypothetical protein
LPELSDCTCDHFVEPDSSAAAGFAPAPKLEPHEPVVPN